MWKNPSKAHISCKVPVDNYVDNLGSYQHYQQGKKVINIINRVINRQRIF